MIAFLIGLTIIAVVGAIAGLHYAKREHAEKHGTSTQIPLPTEQQPRYARRTG